MLGALITSWWQLKYFYIFTPKLGEDEPNLTYAYFSDGLVQPPTRNHYQSDSFWHKFLQPVGRGTPPMAPRRRGGRGKQQVGGGRGPQQPESSTGSVKSLMELQLKNK